MTIDEYGTAKVVICRLNELNLRFQKINWNKICEQIANIDWKDVYEDRDTVKDKGRNQKIENYGWMEEENGEKYE